MHHSSHGLRIALLAGASVVALVAAAPGAGAADLSKPTLTKAPPPAPAPRERWAWWIEGGAFNPSGDAFSLGARVSNIRPKWGWEAAAGLIGCRAGDSGISAANSATVQRKKLKHSRLGWGRHQRLLLHPPEAQHLLWLRATTRKYVTITGWSILPSAAISA